MASLKHFTNTLARKHEAVAAAAQSDALKSIMARCFKQQYDFVADRHRYKAALCPRRSGKTFACTSQLCYTALTRPGSNLVYLALTKGQARANMWPYLKQFAQQFELNLRFHETYLTATFPNGSKITLSGAETRAEIEKLRGSSYDLVVIDECKSFEGTVLEELLWQVINPALSDRLGSLVMIGTPGNILAGPFYESTRPEADLRDDTWSSHFWHIRDNVAMPHIWKEALAWKAQRNIPDNDPVWLREHMGEWCPSESLMVYRLVPDALWDADGDGPHGLPKGHDWKYLLGMDIGFRDDTAISVLAYADTHPNLYQVHDWKEPGLTIDGIERAVKRTQDKFGEFEAMVADKGALGMTIVESLIERGYPFIAAQKREKYDHIELLNTEMASGRLKILRGGHTDSEMRHLQFTDKTYKKEDPSCDNHACDATLYIHTHAHHNLWEPAPVEIKVHSNEWYEQREEEAFQAAVARRKQKDEIGLDDEFQDVVLDVGTWN